MSNLTFRSTKIIYYGPHACTRCGVEICKMGSEWGGNAFTYPEGPIYPNTEWHVHVCDPGNVYKFRARNARDRVRSHPMGNNAEAVFSKQQGWMITANDDTLNMATGHGLTYIADEATAWLEAKKHLFPDEGEAS